MRTVSRAAAGALLTAAALVVASGAQAAETITYGYDARGRLVRVAHGGGVNDGVATTYAHDRVDNRLAKTVTGASCVALVPLGDRLRSIPCRRAS